jgi:predicted DNA-binding ribbon-helix-helix protein
MDGMRQPARSYSNVAHEMSKGTPHRAIRIDDALWDRVRSQAAVEGITTSDLIRQLLRGWLNNNNETQGEK